MKKNILILLLVTTLIGCSKNETTEETSVPVELIGSWQFKGIYIHDVFDENDMPLYMAYENGDIITYNSDNTFIHLLQNYQYTGTFSVVNSNILNLNYNPNPNGINNNGSSKITLLTENELRLSCFNEGLCDVIRYEKVVAD